MKIHNRVAIGLVLGVLTGVILGSRAGGLEVLGTIFVRAIRMLIVPLIASSLVMAIAALPGRAAMGKLGGRAFGFLLLSLVIALLIGITAGHFLAPGVGISDELRGALMAGQDLPELDPNASRPTLLEILIEVVPANPIQAAVEGNVLQVLFVSILFGLAASALPETTRKPVIDLARSVAEVLFKLVGWILELAPFGVFGLMAAVVGRSGIGVLANLAAYVGVVLLALVLHILIVYAPTLILVARTNLKKFLTAARPPVLITFATCSTAAALPVSMQTMRQDLGLSSHVTSFVLPLGAAIGRDGSAIYQAVSVLFVAQVYGVTLGASDLLTLMVTAVLSSLAVASVPAASFVNLAILLAALGIPIEGAALVFGVERPLDMIRSSTNIVGHLVNASFVGSRDTSSSDELPHPV